MFGRRLKNCVYMRLTTTFSGNFGKIDLGLFFPNYALKVITKVILIIVVYLNSSWCTAERQEQQETLDFINSSLEDVTEQIKSKIQNISEEVEMQVSFSLLLFVKSYFVHIYIFLQFFFQIIF